MKHQMQNFIIGLGLFLAVLCLSDRASATVFVNRVLQLPTPTDPCPFVIGQVNAFGTWDGNFQNAYGDCRGLDKGPPFNLEAPVEVPQSASLEILDRLGDPLPLSVSMSPGGTLVVVAGGALTIVSASGSGSFLMGPLTGVSVNGSLVARGVSFSGSNRRPINFHPMLSAAVTAHILEFENCAFNFNFPASTEFGIITAQNSNLPATIRIKNSTFSSSGAPGFLVNLVGVNTDVEISDSRFSGVDGQALRISSVKTLILTNNVFENTLCSNPFFADGVACGAPVLISDAAIQSIAGNVGMNNAINGIFLGGVAATGNASWSTVGDFLLVIDAPVSVGPGDTLTLGPGTILKFKGQTGMNIEGTLNADGVVFTSLNDDSVGGSTVGGAPPPRPGDWGLISIAGREGGGFPRASATFNNCLLRFGGASNNLAPIFHRNRASLVVTDSTISQSSGRGLLVGWSGSDTDAVVRGNTITDNVGTGIEVFNALDGVTPSTTIESNTITGNAHGIEVTAGISSTAPLLSRNLISGNRGNGIVIGHQTSPFIVNNIISANSLDGITQPRFAAGGATLRIVNNSIFGNGGHGIRVQINSPPVPIVNNLITENVGFAIFEEEVVATSQSTPRFNDLFGNGAGLFFARGSTSLTLAQINMLPGAGGNISGNPLLGIPAQGFSTDLTFDPATGTSTLTSSVPLTPDSLVGLTINPNLNQQRRFLITANTDTTITVLGDMRTVAMAGDNYSVIDPLSYYPLSPLIDAGENRADLPATDFAGRPRIIDGGRGLIVDIGAHEFDPQAGN